MRMNRNKINVAIVDDDASFAVVLERRFHVSGFEVRTYPSAEGFLFGRRKENNHDRPAQASSLESSYGAF